MTPSLKSLLRAGRFLALLGVLALSFTQEISGLWLYITWLMLAFSIILDRYPQFEQPLRRWETLAVMSLISLTFLDFLVLKNSLFIVVAHFLLLLQTFKLVGLKERKDALQIGLIGFFQLLAACTLSADIWQAILLILLIPGTTALLFWNYAARIQEEAQVKTSWPDRSLSRLHAALSVSSLPLNIALTVVVFVLFPRLTFNVHVPGFGAGTSAYTDQMNLGQSGSVTQDSSVAAWMGFSDDAQRDHWDHYLRGDVLDAFDGKQWANTHQEKNHSLQPDSNGVFKLRRMPAGMPTLHATVTLLNTAKNTLFTLGTPIEIMAPFPHLEFSDAGDFHWNIPLHHPLQYQVMALVAEHQETGVELTAPSAMDMQVPQQGLERTKLLSDRIAGNGSNADKAHALEGYLRENYHYNLSFGQTVPDNPVDYFLFESRQGFCIHFASALAVMLRLERIPSRVIAGYYHGEWNPLARQILFREQDAHAWVEAWVDGEWITLDPSPRAVFETASRAREHLAWLRLRETWDYLGYEWNRVIIEYDLYAQLRAWEHVRNRSDRVGTRWLRWWTQWRARTPHAGQTENSSNDSVKDKPTRHWPWSMTIVVVIGLMIAGWITVRRSAKSEVPVFYLRFLRRMARLGFEKKSFETAAEFAQRAVRHRPKEAARIEEITSAYYRFRFGKK